MGLKGETSCSFRDIHLCHPIVLFCARITNAANRVSFPSNAPTNMDSYDYAHAYRGSKGNADEERNSDENADAFAVSNMDTVADQDHSGADGGSSRSLYGMV
jgi:hypothetical protein